MSKVKVTSPNHEYNGVTAGVQFVNGEGEVDTNDRAAVEYFGRKGYGIATDIPAPKGEDKDLAVQKTGSAPEPFNTWDLEKLIAYAEQHQIRYPKDADAGTLVGLLEGRDAANGNETAQGNNQSGIIPA